MTDEQVENWRKLLCTAYGLGPYAFLMPKEDIIKLRDKFQGIVDSSVKNIDTFFDMYTNEFDVTDTARKGECGCCKKSNTDVHDCTDLDKKKFTICADCLTMATGE